MLNSLFGKESIVGLDIGSNSIKAVTIESSGKGWTLTNAAIAPTPYDSIKDGVIIKAGDVAQAIKSLLKDSDIKATGAICAISGTQVTVRNVTFPKMAESALRNSIVYEAKRFITSANDDSCVEFEILGDAQEQGQMNVMLVASPNEMVESRVRTIEAAGLEPIAVDIEAFALIRSLIDLHASDEYITKNIAILDIGASHTEVNIAANGEFTLTRNIPIAGDSFTNAIKNSYGISFEEAEKSKLLLNTKQLMENSDEDPDDMKRWNAVQPLVDELIREIRRSINYYQSQFPENSNDAIISKIVLCGGSAQMPGIDSYISSRLGIPIQLANVFTQSAINTGKISNTTLDSLGCVFGVAAGLALKELVPETKQKAA